jgi:hypothetical protein
VYFNEIFDALSKVRDIRHITRAGLNLGLFSSQPTLNCL